MITTVRHRAVCAAVTRRASILIALVIVASCSSSDGGVAGDEVVTTPGSAGVSPAGSDATDTTLVSEQTSGTTGSSASAATDAAPTDELLSAEPAVFGPGTFDLESPTVGLDALSSYRATLTLTFVGTLDGAPDEWSTTSVMSVSADPSVSALVVESVGGAAPGTVWRAVRDGVEYDQIDGGPCTADVVDPDATLAATMEPAGGLFGIVGADPIGVETIEGVTTTHASFDQRAIGGEGFSTSAGEVWAADSGLVLRYELTTTGESVVFGAGVAGTATWTYALTEIDQPITVELPADCPAGLLRDLPVTADATDVLSGPSVTTYQSASTPADVAAFYVEQLGALGWAADPTPVVGDGIELHDFVRGIEQLSFTASSDEFGTTVILVMATVEV